MNVIRILLSTSAIFCFAGPALAETVPCRVDPAHEIQICGSGNGAAIVIRDTQSPDGKLALAWRVPDAPPTEEPDVEKIQLLLLRLSDGKILSQTRTEYWDTGKMHSNHPHESAYWSQDSKYLIRSFSARYGSDVLELYAVGKDDAVSGPFDLLKLLNAPLRARLKRRLKKMDPEDFVFILAAQNSDKPAVRAGANGSIGMDVMFWRMKNGPSYYYTVDLKAAREKSGLSARIVSVRYRGMEKADE